MPNMRLEKYLMPCLKLEHRNNFKEVQLGLTEDLAIKEANRCLNCASKPCVEGCPVNIEIPDFIKKIKEKDFESAYQIISKNSSLSRICGRVCPQEMQCEKNCVRNKNGESVAIGNLERFVSDYHYNNFNEDIIVPKKNNHKIAIIGSGPAGLACAFELAKKGYLVKIFEALHELGGVLVYGIPEFRLPNDVVKSEIDKLKKLGVEMITNVVIGKTFTIDDLFSMGYEYIFIATGAGFPNFMNIKGENLKGVYSANEFLTRINLMKSYDESSDTPILKAKNVAVIGGGNVAMDAARCAKRLGANNVYIIYRRGMDELPARKEEVFHATEEGIIFNVLSNIIEIIPDENNCVKKIKCIKMRLGEVDSSNRRKPVEILNSYFYLDVDSVIMAIGTSPNPLIKNSTKNLATDSKGLILTVNNDGLTTLNNVYAGGDAVSNASTVINAMGAGKKAALAIDDEIRTK